MLIWNLPGVHRFFDRIAGAVDEHDHVVARLPDGLLDLDPARALAARFTADGLGPVHEIWSDPLEPLMELPADPAAGSDLARQSPVYVVTGVRADEDPHAEVWRRHIEALRRVRHDLGRSPHRLVFVTSPAFSPPTADLGLSHHDWWGVFGTVDVDHIVDLTLDEGPASSTVDHYWYRALCRGVARTDPLLALHLIEQQPREPMEVIRSLRAYERAHREPFEALREDIILLGHETPDPPRDPVERRLWTRGAFDWQRGHGRAVASHTIASGPGCEETIHHRLWVGQLEILLPLAERVRQLLAGQMPRLHVDPWTRPVRSSWQRGGKRRGSRRSTLEWKTLASIFKNAVAGGRLDLQDHKHLARRWYSIRNSIAHHEWIGYQRLADALDALATLQARGEAHVQTS